MERQLREAAEYGMLSLLFSCPVGEWRERVLVLRGDMGDGELGKAADAALLEGEEGVYHSMFGPGGPAPAREVSYVESLQLGYLMAELQAYYEAFGFEVEEGEPPDHVAVELRFLSLMKVKEAYAEASGDEEGARVTREAHEGFVAEHLRMMGEPLAAALAGCGIVYLEKAGAELVARSGRRPALPFPIVGEEEEDGCMV